MVTMNSEVDKTQSTALNNANGNESQALDNVGLVNANSEAATAAAAATTTTITTTAAVNAVTTQTPPPAPPATTPITNASATATIAGNNCNNSVSINSNNSNSNNIITTHTSSVPCHAPTVAAATPPPPSKTVTHAPLPSANANASASSNASSGATPSSSSAPKSNALLNVSSNHHHHHHHQQQQQQQAPQPTAMTQHHGPQRGNKNEDAPNILVYKKMESIIEKMQAESSGVAVRTVKAFMSKVPSVFTGADLVAWILKNFDVEDVTEALHFAHLLSSHGYIFPIDDHALTVKNDGTFYRFQTPYFWPSNCWEPENTDYAVYLCKRTMQNKTRLELADYEAENLAKLQKMFSRKWEFIFMQAESQSKVAKKRDKLERKVLDSQERAFWDVHRPMPGCVNTTEIDIKKAYRRGGSSHGTGSAGASVAKNPVEQLTRIIALRKQKLERRTIKVSKAAEALVAYYEQYNEFDYFITSPELPNPWQTDSTEMWDTEKNSKDVPVRRVKRWAFSLRELLNDAIGREQFTRFLEKEYSGENLKFWESVQEMKALPQSEIKEAIQNIWQEFLAPDAPCPVNVDSKSVELAREAVTSPNGPNRWCFDVAASHVYHLMKSDSYSRYLRSDMYKDYLNCSRKKIKSIPNLFGVKR
ncbi:regulator of G-protein signaling 7 [Scaptodrosophila lebanonensis]|uniref:Regulator of G-protein signaling 7 n=1 Tax=Drosophila lebanonensis TaxID=7225 RepID=A0A6J2TTA0_DROLE|nr:regulator of G-protein signaling 7 [Scaptodrosophila lebanonensis]